MIKTANFLKPGSRIKEVGYPRKRVYNAIIVFLLPPHKQTKRFDTGEFE